MTNTALYTKVHARYGKGLKNSDYRRLISLNSVTDVAKYLREKTVYGSVLSTVKGNDFHRGYLEKLIRRHYKNDKASITEFEKAGNTNLYKYFYNKNSAQEILRFIRLFNLGRQKEYILVAPKNEDIYSAVDISKLLKAESFDDILNSITDKKMRKRLENTPGILLNDGTVNYAISEFTLKDYIIEALLESSKKQDKATETEIRKIFNTRSELEDVEHIYRMKRLNIPVPEIRKYLSNRYCKIPPRIKENMVNAKSADEVMEIFWNTHYKIYLDRVDRENVNDFIREVYFYFIKNFFIYSLNPSASTLAYTALCEFEAENLFRIIEGIRYGVDKNEIEKMIIGYKEVQ